MIAAAFRAVAGDARRPPLGWVFVAVAAACVLMGLFADRPIILWLSENMSEETRDIFRVITQLGDATGWIVTLAVATLACFAASRMERFSAIRTTLKVHAWNFWFVILSCAMSGLIHHILKIVIGRARPRYLFSEDVYGVFLFTFEIARNSFPSGHTQTIVSICVALYLVHPRFLILYLMVGGMVALSRIALLAHFPGDTLAGAYLGLCTAILLKRHYLDPRVTRVLNPADSGR